jgi:predicted RNase H-like nuclease (RuvC/YqgF family)
MFKSQTSTRDETISSLQTELKALETMLEEQNQNKADLEYSLRASEYNVEILKN